ncbi:hypothetical protein GIY56_15355 [Paracoccus sp. YIM 132242]|uniref:Uncharacterized protein n=1 Tax=Paracoccus lichenicola TaxID=2665644 RepID=A0A6L6HU86_9RHOB|nr:hypothetical protein [Paracoccus lichenicola]
MKRSIIRLAAGAATASFLAAPVDAYPIDCAILLCMAGGFPASAECSAAKAEVIRRITPWPIEPPLQLWRCPMSNGVGLVGAPDGGAGTVPPEVAAYRDAIELWSLSKYVTTGSGGRDIYVNISRSSYSPSGTFVRRPASENDLPAWLDTEIREHTGSPLMNEYGPGFRSIVFRMQDYTGAYSTEWISW